MAETKMTFFSAAAVAGLLFMSGVSAGAQDFTLKWSKHAMNASRTGCVSASADNADEAIGIIDGNRYVSPNGNVFTDKGTTYDVASIVLAAQSVMSDVKQVVGYSPEAMPRAYPESAVSNLFVDVIMQSVGELADEDVDVGITNFGGIRIDMPEGDILLDDILSMFPFKNTLVYLELSGKRLMEIFSQMAETEFQVLGGVRIVAENGRIVSAEIGGEPVDEDEMYGVATISFLLNGGDGLYLADGAENMKVFQIDIKDVMLDYVKSETAAGRPITYHADGRVVIL